MNTRRGVSLAELLVVLSGCAVILSLTGQLMHRAMRTQSETRHFFDLERTADRLASDFRRDIRAARSVAAEDSERGEGALAALELNDDVSVEYLRQGAIVVRTAMRPGGQSSREEYPLSAAMDVRIEVEGSPQRATLSVVCATPEAPKAGSLQMSRCEPLIDVRAVAIVGRDHRFEQNADREEGKP
jgi:type II secretory pathway component PulJ